MYRVGVKFRKSKAKLSKKPGAVYIEISDGFSTDDNLETRMITTDLKGNDASVLDDERESIIKLLKQLYCIVELLHASGDKVNFDNIYDRFKQLLAADYSDNIVSLAAKKAETDFIWQNELLYVPFKFRKYIRTDNANMTLKKRLRKVSEEEIPKVSDLITFIKLQIHQLKVQGTASRAENYTGCLNKLIEFSEDKAIPFDSINPSFIRSYEDYLKSKTTLQESTQSLYIRCLRAIINQADAVGYLTVGNNWFADTNRRVIFDKKETLTPEDARGLLTRIVNIDLTDDPKIAEMRDIFLFGFYCRGLEYNDILSLTTDNIENGRLVYLRRGKGKKQSIPLEEKALAIIERYKSYRSDDDNHLFPFTRQFSGFSPKSIRSFVARLMHTLGQRVDYPKLTLSLNITLWKVLFSEASISSALL